MSWTLEWAGDVLSVDGEISESCVSAFCMDLIRNIKEGPAVIDMIDLEIVDGLSMAKIVTVLRTGLPLTLKSAPQMLAHTIYKTGMMRPEAFVLITPREDEGQGT